MSRMEHKEKMKVKNSNQEGQFSASSSRGYTLIELLVGSAIMLGVILTSLTLYNQSNKVSADQQQYSEIQHEVRFALFFISRDIRSAGAGLPEQFAGYFFQGINNDTNQGGAAVQSDRLIILGNSDPLRLDIQSYVPGANTIQFEADELDNYPYIGATYPGDLRGYLDRIIIILPNPELSTLNGELGRITAVDFATEQITFDRINVTLANGLQPGGAAVDYVGGTVHFVEYKIYWLDVDGNYTGLTAGQNGYLGEPGVLYVSQWNTANSDYDYLPLAQGIEDFQLQYHGDLDGDHQLDDNNGDSTINKADFLNWDDNITWTDNPGVVDGIQSVRIQILGRTENPFFSVEGLPPERLRDIYGKPLMADSPQANSADKHRRFLLESTVNVRTMSLSLYNTGTR